MFFYTLASSFPLLALNFHCLPAHSDCTVHLHCPPELSPCTVYVHCPHERPTFFFRKHCSFSCLLHCPGSDPHGSHCLRWEKCKKNFYCCVIFCHQIRGFGPDSDPHVLKCWIRIRIANALVVPMRIRYWQV
jgi:hypothetical protein